MAVVPLQYRFDGPRHAPVVLLLPALGTKWSIWEPQMPELTREARVLRVNHRGHGESPAPEGAYTIAELGGDVLALLDRCEVDRCAVVGVGLGGMTATWLAAREPERVSRLALLSTAAQLPPAARWQRLAALARSSGTVSVVSEYTRSWFTPGFADQRPDIVSRLADELEEVGATGYAGCCDAVATVDQRALLARVRAPTMVVSAVHDPETPPGYGQRIAAGIPGARFETVAGAAHLVNIERADRVNELLVEHLGI
ncbi:alpha/beta fold hydrolase [Marinitenerispora sediminis]|uniref:Alpha/beta hydrolase n=1 Tax=Marinitenerispora sediminis TaxID=1931232 RepID=A0A368TAR0_9ACTN|nr:alpha/beta fold hydrolase [Marinitenerispora sediminis]RCV50777.1 alpha/beta hydrolase [Marinitenerispora sediminis]RCV52669.1 alpha/beta hydrolase [Marinitenerispora sediminis]RCV62085.1 alpha/beta hydrolase [Marinitenerispora sediminis]